ncbi:MAG: hypothetical protein Q7T57_00470 [Dehalococcoidales bacterium]|jgi:hypothetical protein|nr:hypothetical protein [Dehalococcoidales bacterium]
MPPQFFGREIQVITGGEVKSPTAFTLDKSQYTIAEIVREWHDHSFGPTATGRRKRWWERRHRNYYLVKTTDGELFEIYYDRGANLKHPELRKWYAHRKL